MTDVDDNEIAAEIPEATDDMYVGKAVAFFLGGQRYALPIARVQEIQQIVAFSEVPSGGAGVVGMVNLRGQVIPAVDLRRVVGLPSQDYTLETPMIVCHVGDTLVACVVDEVQDVLDIPAGCVQEPPKVHAMASKMLGVARMTDGLVYLLDIEGVLGSVLTGGW